MVKISVILPNFNHGDFLKLRIDSILNQEFEDFELIILDDCSTDNSREIIELYQNHPKVTSVILNDKNSGSTFLQWEKGIKQAKGEYIWLAESDDYSDTRFLKEIGNVIQNNPDVGLLFSASNIVDQDNRILHKNYQYGPEITQLLSHNFIMDGKAFCEQFLFFGCVLVNASAVVFKKNLFENIEQDYKEYKVSGDWRMWVEICYQTKIAYLNESLNYFRFHNNNVRTNKSSLMNREAIFNYIASFKKTDSNITKDQLKRRLFVHWCFEFSRDFKNGKFGNSLRMMKSIIKIDHRFLNKLFNHLFHKIFSWNKASS